MDARGVGGAIALEELDRLWQMRRQARRVLFAGGEREFEQIRIIFDGAAEATLCDGVVDVMRLAATTSYDLIITSAPDIREALASMPESFQGAPALVWIDANPAARSTRRCPTLQTSSASAPVLRPHASLRDRLNSGDRLNVVLLNDVGFQYGAGIAMRRQAASLLLLGWNVSVLAWRPGLDIQQPAITGLTQLPNWNGVQGVSNVHRDDGLSDDQIAESLADKIQSMAPDLVIAGNVHGAGWPVGLFAGVRRRGIPIVAYMHDVYWATGRCAYPLTCPLYRTGCDARCPTPDEYPRLEPDKIAQAWQDKGAAFTGAQATPLVANSRWTRDMALQQFGDAALTSVVHLAVDHELFAPMDKQAVRRLIGLPEGKSIVAMGATHIHDQWKGGPLFHELHRMLVNRNDVELILFGQLSERLKSTKSFGLITDERLMPFVYNAADIFVSVAAAEAFGQTMLEASACGVPVIAFPVGGTTDVVVHEETGLLVDPPSTKNLLAAIDKLVSDRELRESLGRNGRNRVEQNFTLERQANAWVDCLKKLC